MAPTKVEDIRNIVFCGHGSAGKTTLVDKISDQHRHGQAPRQRRRRHQHLRLRRGREAPQAHDRIDAGPLRARRQALQRHRHARLSRLHRPGDRRLAGRRHGGDRHQRPRRASRSTRGACSTRPARPGLGRMIVINKMDADNIDFPALVESIQELFGKACVLLNVPLGHGADFQRRGQHAQAAGRRRRRADRSRRDSASRCRGDHRSRRGRDRALLRGHAAHRRGDRRG